MTDQQIERQIDTNVIAPIQLARSVTPHLRDQGGGIFLQTSSMGDHIAFPAMSMYHTSKWGIEGFFEAYALETEPFGIHTTLIEPGMVATDFYGSADITPSQLPAYPGTQAADFTHGKNSVPLDAMPGDPRKVAEAVIRIGDPRGRRGASSSIPTPTAWSAMPSPLGWRALRPSADLLDELAPDRATFARLDVTSEEDWTPVVATAEAAIGSVSVLVNSVARAIVGTFLGTRAAVPSMRRRGGGSIVDINSTAGIGAAGGPAAYGTSKWGI
ncbi:SDR family NAD(P)-dependent oxidoreductase [Streptomyces sp. NPDC059697]|uniref:SDR family NAD(P)-dependent oxidoreductase n=1 Tax=Streptomyces sp. NPDC059697 TaxID=3346912 RepID=UPI0036C12FA8